MLCSEIYNGKILHVVRVLFAPHKLLAAIELNKT